LLEAFIDHTPIGIAMFNRNLHYIRSSRRWQAVMGASDSVLIGRHHYLDFPEIPAKWIDAHQRGLAGETVKGEDEWVPPDGKLVRTRWEVHPWGDAGAETGGIIILFEDVTQARSMEAELRHAHKMEALGQLAGGVAHDFNNLLQIIQGYTEMLQDQLGHDGPGSQHAAQVLQAARRASGLTSQLLAFSRKQIPTLVVLDLNEIIRNTSKMLKRLLGEDVVYRVDLAEPLWRVEADADHLSQVLINLCVNSRDAMPRGGRLTIATHNLTVETDGFAGRTNIAPGDHVVLTVGDTGSGMEPQVLERIFEPFFTTKEAGKGTGLGLSTVYGIVRQSGGDVWAESVLGEGTCFTVCLPRTSKQGSAAATVAAGKTLRGDQTLMIVEDDEDVLRAIAEYLPTLGYRVLTAHPSQALSLASRHPGIIDLLITDVVMPEISGPVLAEKISAHRPGLRTIFMSGYIDDAVTRHGVLESKAPFLQKPFTLAELAATIRKALAGF
jgi:PAS domain S-box-containing protein